MMPGAPDTSIDGSGGASPSAPGSTGPVGQGDHVVRPGECISSIARDVGQFWETIWNDPANAELKAARKDPNVLLPGDRLTIPKIKPRQESCAAEARHRFVRRGEPAEMHLRILEDGEPRANEPYTLEVDGQTFDGTTDGDGNVVLPIPGNARHARLVVGPSGDQVTYKLALGSVDPVSELSGVQGRLQNLGFDCGTPDGQMGPRTQAALRAFQRRNKLPVTGEPDDATRAKLEEVHGH